jgi:hypothetical protein
MFMVANRAFLTSHAPARGRIGTPSPRSLPHFVPLSVLPLSGLLGLPPGYVNRRARKLAQ